MIKTLKYLNLIFFILMVCINILANILPLGYGNTGAISEKYPNLYTPAPITFSIWGIIYIMLGIFIVYQLGCFSIEKISECLVEQIGPWFIVSCILNIAWILSWHYDRISLSSIIMLLLLFSLIIITVRISPCTIQDMVKPIGISFFTKISIYAFDVYLGWITAATIANLSVLLVKCEWNRFGLSEPFWTVIMLLVGTILGILFIVINRRYMSAAAIVWAYCGILIKHISQSGHAGNYPVIITITIVGIVAILSTIVITMILHRN